MRKLLQLGIEYLIDIIIIMCYIRSAEMDMLANDLERANQRALTSEKQVETMNKLMGQQNSMSPDTRVYISVYMYIC